MCLRAEGDRMNLETVAARRGWSRGESAAREVKLRVKFSVASAGVQSTTGDGAISVDPCPPPLHRGWSFAAWSGERQI